MRRVVPLADGQISVEEAYDTGNTANQRIFMLIRWMIRIGCNAAVADLTVIAPLRKRYLLMC
jgi:hypothetical protein